MTDVELYFDRRQRKVCLKCGGEKARGRNFCTKCKGTLLKDHLFQIGICQTCKNARTVSGISLCENCRQKYNKERNEHNRKKRLASLPEMTTSSNTIVRTGRSRKIELIWTVSEDGSYRIPFKYWEDIPPFLLDRFMGDKVKLVLFREGKLKEFGTMRWKLNQGEGVIDAWSVKSET